MKLELIKKFENKHSILTAVSLDENTAVFLSYDDEIKYYQLLFISENEYKIISLDYTEKYYSIGNAPVLFSIGNRFGIIKNQNELLLYSNENQSFEAIKIDKTEVLPKLFHLEWRVPISDSSILPVCFRNDVFSGDTRYIAFLNLDISNKKANWESWISLDTKAFPYHKDNTDPPKMDTAMLKNEELYAFSSGGNLSSVAKWGMDYYAFVKCDLKGNVTEKLIDSGDLHSIDQKKRGVNGLFSSSQKYLMLTPVFQSDEWKGKQKIFCLEKNETSDIIFPRGFGKYPQIIEHYGDYFWVYLRDTKEIAICKKE